MRNYGDDAILLATLERLERIRPGSLTAVLMLWDVAERKAIATIPAHADRSYSVLFTPDGKTLVTASMDKTIKIWDVATRENVATLTSVPIDGAAPRVPNTPKPRDPAGPAPNAKPSR